MATKKTSRKKKARRKLLDTDPPILVGGGGSAYIWVNLNENERPVNPSSNDPNTGINPGAPTPRSRGNYTASRVTGGPTRIFFYDGVNLEVQLDIPVAGRKTWYIRFA